MPETAPFGLRYPANTEPANIPLDMGELAGDVNGWLSRVLVCTSGTRPSSPPPGMVIREDDTGAVLYWDDTGSEWVPAAGSGGGGGGGATVVGRWRASGAQSIPNATDTAVGFGSTDQPSAVVTRATHSGGHKFVLDEAGDYTIQPHVRFAAGPVGSRFLGLRNVAGTFEWWSDQNDGGPAAATRQFAYRDVFAAGTELVIVAAQSSGGSLSTVPTAVTPTGSPYVRLTIIKHG